MDDESRIMALVEEILDSNATPEEACREYPRLLPAVRNQLERFRSVEAHVDEVFPPRASSDGPPIDFLRRASRALPTIPGYQVLEMVGAGGMGVVYRARHSRLNRVVAIKMLLAGGFAGQRDLERFKRETESIAALCHPNIVQVFDAGEHDGYPYFVMEFMEKGTLSHALKGTPLPAGKAAVFAVVLARAVHFAHQSGIIHRDLKPGNVLLASDDTPKVADFGLAGRLGANDEATVTLNGGRQGTPSYMAPEQASGPVSAHASRCPGVDVYGLGAILYEMLTGRPPFRGETAAETERQVIHDDPVPPALLNPRTPRDLQTICLKCLQKLPAQRYASALELAEDLDRFLNGDPIKARPISPLERTVRRIRKKPSQAALILTASLLFALAASLGLGAWRSAARRSAEIAAWTPRLDIVRQREREGKLQDARALLPRPLDVEANEVRSQVQDALAELDFANKLDAIRDGRQEIVNGRFDLAVNLARSDKAYETIFQEANFGRFGDDPAEAAARIARSPIRPTLVASMDDWSVCPTDEARVRWIMEVARRADPDSSEWRDRVRQPRLSRELLAELAASAVVQDQSPQLLMALASRMRSAGADVIPFLDRVQRQYSGDFWASYCLGEALFDKNPTESIRYYQAALTGHPESALGHHAVGQALEKADRTTEATLRFRQALRLEPTFAHAKSDLGWALVLHGNQEQAAEGLRLAREAAEQDGSAQSHGKFAATLGVLDFRDDAIAEFRRSFAVDPNFFWGHINLATCFEQWDRLDEAMEELEHCRRLDPDSGWVHLRLGTVLRKQGRIEDAMAELNVATRLDAQYVRAGAHTALGDCWRSKGSLQLALTEYDQARLLVPADPNTLRGRREVMVQLGLGVAARVEWEQALEANPADHTLWNGYAELCAYLQDQDAYEKACHRLLDLFGSSADPQVCERSGRACLLGTLPPADAARAAALIERVVQADLPPHQAWTRPYFLVAQGLANYRVGNFDGAIDSIGEDSQKVLGPLPHLVLAMAHQRAGHRAEALRSYARALQVFDWDPSHASGPDEWMFHALRREADRVVNPNLDAPLTGRESPRDQVPPSPPHPN